MLANIFKRADVKRSLLTLMNKREQIRSIKVEKISEANYLVTVPEAKRFVFDSMRSIGVKQINAQIIAETLIYADTRGDYSSGLYRLELILSAIEKGVCHHVAEPAILKETPTTMLVDGMHGLGPVIGEFCVEKAIKKAEDNSIVVIAVRNSHYAGSLAYHISKVLEAGMMGILCSNTPIAMCPDEAAQSVLGTNPICFGAPGEADDSFIFNMSTTSVSFGHIEVIKNRGLPLPLGMAKDILGRATTSPSDAVDALKLYPAAGNKGLGLSIVSELLTSILSNADYGKKMITMHDFHSKPVNMAQCFIVVNARKLSPNVNTLVSQFLNNIRNADPIHHSAPVMVAGDKARAHLKQVEELGGILYFPSQIDKCIHLARKLQVTPLKYCCSTS